MPQSQDDEGPKAESSTEVALAENASEDASGGCQNGAEQTLDGSTSYYLDQKQINKRFTELLNFFEGYAKIMDGDQKQQLKRALSPDHSAGIGSDHTIKAATCEVSIQTSRTLLEQQQNDSKAVEEGGVAVCTKEKPSQLQQHTIHIEVETVPSETEMHRAPLRQRFGNVLLHALEGLVSCLYMVGDNITYVMLFGVLCIWCFYR
ncbi:uncharacterized protein LOC111080555 [Drosophila obscura]|uniref:uncharacterized protein LOC111080555 n=1 Tax=Drosophila obscura TaxID=7282 RepID=UPI001BB25108|nr:uncharacterized protein LOC111080555 [Drosophila obscura]